MSDVIIVNIEEPIQNNDIELTTHNEKENISPNEKTDVELIRQPSENLEKTDIQLIPEKDVIEEESKKCLDTLIEKFFDDGVIDNNELTEIIRVVIELVEVKIGLSGSQKKNLALSILRQFLESKMSKYDEVEKQISKSIDFAVKVSKEGFGEIKIMSSTISDLKTGFNFIFSSTMSKIEEKYPKDKETEGEVVRLANFGALVKLETGVEGLIHISKLAGGVSLKEGEKVQVYIESIDVAKRKISLGIVETNKKNVIYK